jgi:hypothetical protein
VLPTPIVNYSVDLYGMQMNSTVFLGCCESVKTTYDSSISIELRDGNSMEGYCQAVPKWPA